MHSDRGVVIQGTGEVLTKFLSVSFKVQVQTRGVTGPQAKAEAQPRVEEIKAVLAKFQPRAKLDLDAVRTSYEVAANHKYDDHVKVFDGYTSTYTAAFKAHEVGEAIALHDALTSITGVEASTPVFNFDLSPEIEKKAFEIAYKQARETFLSQLAITAQNGSDWTLSRWALELEREGSGKMVSYKPADAGVKVDVGRAVLTRKYSFLFEKKGPESIPLG